MLKKKYKGVSTKFYQNNSEHLYIINCFSKIYSKETGKPSKYQQ